MNGGFAAACVLLSLVGCTSKPPQESGELRARHITSDQLPPDMRQSVEETARRQATAATRMTTKIHRAYEYKGYSWHEPTSLGKLVAVDVEFAGYTSDFDLDDIDLVDGLTGENYGSNPQVTLLRSTGDLAQDEQKEWPAAPKALRLLLIYAAPRTLKAVRLNYWDEDLTPKAVALAGTGLALPAPERNVKR